MEKRTGSNWLRWLCIGLLCLSGMVRGALRAEGVPPVIKYQAVLRDIEGEPMVERADLGIRITLRQGLPDGKILYQETHTDKATDAFGLLLLEIGRGQVSNAGCGSLSEVPWANSPIYAQVEIQADDNGYTTMGASELLSVPYALYAGEAGVGLDLADGYLPKYDAEKNGFVNSNIYQTNEKIVFSFEGGEDYAFPVVRGQKGEVLTVMDENGTLGWRVGGSGGADCPECDDMKFVYWDEVSQTLKTAGMRYDDQTGGIYVDDEFVSQESTRLEGGVVINADVSGDNNLQYNGLSQNNVWVGGADNKSHQYILGSGVSIDDTDPNHPVLNFGGGHTAWDSRIAGNSYYIYTKDEPGKNVQVGVGTGDTPKARFHMEGGSFLLSGDADGNVEDIEWNTVNTAVGNQLYWHSGKGALRMGKYDGDNELISKPWLVGNWGENSVALGTGATATRSDNVAIGAYARAEHDKTMVFGRNALVNAEMALALGTNLRVSGKKAIGIGSGSANGFDLSNADFFIEGAYAIGLGHDLEIWSDSVIAIGQHNAVGKAEGRNIILGSGNINTTAANIEGATGGGNITIGIDNSMATDTKKAVQNNVQIGRQLGINASERVISIGIENSVKGNRSIAIGQKNIILMNRPTWGGICIGRENKIVMGTQDFKNWGPVLIGQFLKNDGENIDRGVLLGRYNAPMTHVNGQPALVIGIGSGDEDRENALELSEEGNLWVPGTVFSNGASQSSDSTLKTDIQPLDADYSVLQALQPVRYRFKADEKQTLQFGFIAQDVEAYFPHLVQADGQGLKSLNYTGLLPVLWQYTQRLEQTVATQAAEIDRLKTEVESLKADVQAIKAAVGIGE